MTLNGLLCLISDRISIWNCFFFFFFFGGGGECSAPGVVGQLLPIKLHAPFLPYALVLDVEAENGIKRTAGQTELIRAEQ